ncbi:MAG: hypothetical protein JWM14_2109 [Chitinophagaceae bacterium]|nr:hypothetical protein [Chitinophagaceae bacterium]
MAWDFIKENGKMLTINKPSTLETFYSISNDYSCARKLIGNQKDYSGFLEKLVEQNFHHEVDERITIKEIAQLFGHDVSKVTKWIRQIYEDIFKLNQAHPELFLGEGIRYNLHVKNYDNFCYFATTLKETPRKYDQFSWWFLNAKMGTGQFYVQDILHEITNGKQQIILYLKGGYPNEYRDHLIERAKFEQTISWKDLYDNRESAVDELLRQTYGYKSSTVVNEKTAYPYWKR